MPSSGNAASKCVNCGDPVLAVLDRRIEASPTGGGNKYRRWCPSCERWNPMSSAEFFDNHRNPHVLPEDGDADDPDCIIPVMEYNDEYDHTVRPGGQDLSDRLAARSGPSPEPIETDGSGESTGDPGGDNSSSPENEFKCPACGTLQTGYPDECSDCGAEYEW